MAFRSSLLVALYSLSCLASAATVPSDSFTLITHREEANREAVNALRKRQSASLPSILGKSLYWFAYFRVGESDPLKLLIDTGSTDLIVNPGKYEPSSNKKPYGTGNFSISYEGVNRAGFGFETINGTTMRDNVTSGGLTVKEQAIGESKSFKYFDVPQLPYPNQGEGIIGFAGPESSSFHPQSNSWFYNLCESNSISHCRLGLLFGTSGKGLTVVGKLAKKYLKGSLTNVPVLGSKKGLSHTYNVMGDIALDNKIVLKNQTIIMDVGTDNIQGPYGETKHLLQKLGYKLHEQTGPNIFDPKNPVKVVTGFFACDKPPTLGFSFPAEADLKAGEKSRIFNVSPDVWDVYDHGNNNCTSILGGTNALGSGADAAWLLGQPFFAGHYIDFDIKAHTIGYGDLTDPAMSSS